MPSERTSDVKLEIGHVLFIDIVGYSKLLITEQSERLETLKKIVRGTEQFRVAEAAGKLLRLPTGDGGALVFRNSPEAPVLCAVEIAKALKSHPELHVRMGIHSGPVNEISDLNEQANIAGAGINIAQRVMDCGDAGHILLSKRVADDLLPYPKWNPYLHELGECEVKHGRKVSLVNFYTDAVGNPEPPAKCQRAASSTARKGGARRLTAIAAAVFFVLAAIAAVLFLQRAGTKRSAPIPNINNKSIAVLPFENLSHDPDNAYFADGIQEEILTRLSKIADLKVISRTSTQHYKSAPDNLRGIAQQLGVSNVLEGSVQKAGDAVRVNVQLIEAVSDTHLWGETYDRKLTDIFGVETDISKTIADMLKAKLSGAEKQAIAEYPTVNPEAHELYLKGRFFWSKRNVADFNRAISYFNQAIEKDPSYALAYAALADTYVILPAFGGGAPRAWVPKAKVAAKKALELDNKLAEAHSALGIALWSYDFDFDQSRAEFQRAIDLNPNYATAHLWFGTWVLTSLGRFDDALAEIKRALELDPLSLINNTDLGCAYMNARRYDAAIDQLRKTVELDPSFYYAHVVLAQSLELKGDFAQAIVECQKAQQLSDDPFILGVLGYAYAGVGKSDETRKVLNQLSAMSAHRYVYPYVFTLLNLALGENKEEAIRWLEKDYQDRDGNNLALIKVDPFLDPLRGNPRFESLVAKIFSPKTAESPEPSP